MDANGHIYYDENGVPVEDAARLNGYLRGRADADMKDRLADLEAKIAEKRDDVEFMERRDRIIEENAEVLQRLKDGGD